MEPPLSSNPTQASSNASLMTSDEPLWISAPMCISARRGRAVLIDKKKGVIGQKVCPDGTGVPVGQSSHQGNGSLRWSSSHTALSPHSGPPSALFGEAEYVR